MNATEQRIYNKINRREIADGYPSDEEIAVMKAEELKRIEEGEAREMKRLGMTKKEYDEYIENAC